MAGAANTRKPRPERAGFEELCALGAPVEARTSRCGAPVEARTSPCGAPGEARTRPRGAPVEARTRPCGAPGEAAMTLDALAGERDIGSPEAMEAFGAEIGGMLRRGDLVVLTGPLGAGKTTLTRGIAAGLGVRGPVQSPTFVIARTHPPLVGGAPLVHVDAYRLGSALELDDLDIDVDRSVVVVEWGRGVVDGLVDTWWEIELERDLGGRGTDTVCGLPGAASPELDADTPRRVTVTRRP